MPRPRTQKAQVRRSARASQSVSFPVLCRASGLPEPIPEFRFHPERRWRFDWAWPTDRIALEQEGGVFIAGRHTRGMGVLKDMEKYNQAAILGWRVIRATPKQVSTGEILTTLGAVFAPSAC